MQVYSHSFFAMNTRFVLVIPELEKSKGDELSHGIESVVNELENCFSRFIVESELSRINTVAFNYKIGVSERMTSILNACSYYHELTNGLFDPALSPLYDCTNKGVSLHKDIEKSRANCGWSQVRWNPIEKTIQFANKNAKLDFGGLGKGMALKEVVNHLKLNQVDNAFLSFGESSIAGMGKHPFGKGWPIGFQEVDGASFCTPEFMLTDEFISVSGLHSVNGFDKYTKEGHIYHPGKNKMIETNKKVMVKCQCPVEAEVLSTAGYLASELELAQLKERFLKAEWCIVNE